MESVYSSRGSCVSDLRRNPYPRTCHGVTVPLFVTLCDLLAALRKQAVLTALIANVDVVFPLPVLPAVAVSAPTVTPVTPSSARQELVGSSRGGPSSRLATSAHSIPTVSTPSAKSTDSRIANRAAVSGSLSPVTALSLPLTTIGTARPSHSLTYSATTVTGVFTLPSQEVQHSDVLFEFDSAETPVALRPTLSAPALLPLTPQSLQHRRRSAPASSSSLSSPRKSFGDDFPLFQKSPRRHSSPTWRTTAM